MSSRQPSVSIIIPIRNGLQDTLRCLESLRRLNYTNYRIIIVDNNSADGSSVAICGAFPKVEIIRHLTNSGFAGGCNSGIKKAIIEGTDYVWLLNNDTVVDPESLASLVRASEQDQNIGMAGSKIYDYDRSDVIQAAGMRISWIRGETLPIGWNQRDTGQFNDSRDVEALHGCSLLIKRAVCDVVGLFDERYFLYAEEIDWCVRARRKGFRCIFVPESVIFHRGGASSQGSYHPQFAYYNTRNMLRTISKSFSFPAKQLFLCTAIIFRLWKIRRNIVKAVFVRLFGNKSYKFDISEILGVIDFFLCKGGAKDRRAIMSFQNIIDA